jgi:hypothetical protein
MEISKSDFEAILQDEDKVLSELYEKQEAVKQSVIDRNWDLLVPLLADVNSLTEKFRTLDSKRDDVQKAFSEDEVKVFYTKLAALRSLLLKCKVQNRVLTDYVNIARDFIKDVVDKALPQTRNKSYSRTGKIVQPQPVSVVVNQLF